jgi:hypothetical protein
MLHAEPVPNPEAMQHVADEIGKRLSRLGGTRDFAISQPLVLGETLPVWVLGPRALQRGAESLDRLAQPTGLWHHQIMTGERSVAFARSMPLGPAPADWKVQEATASPIAGAIAHAIRWTERNVDHDAIARLLILPAYYLHALWLIGSHQGHIVIADRPAAYEALRLEHLYTTAEFLAAVAEQQPASGVPSVDVDTVG